MRVRGRLSNDEPLCAERTALVVVDMQNHFVAEGGLGEVPLARSIVPTINSLTAAMRDAGALVVWIQTAANDALERWVRLHSDVLAPDRARRRIASLDQAAEGFALYPGLDVRPEDLRVTKIHYSAFIAGSSDLDAKLRARGIDTVLIAGTATNVCCDSTARDAMMLNYRVVMLSDANATWTPSTPQRSTCSSRSSAM
jgi:ureidoacrylate peracid hydrolase